MNSTEIRLTERLIQTGRLSAEQVNRCLQLLKGETGLIDTLIRQELISAQDLEKVLAEVPPAGPEAEPPDPLLAYVKRLGRYLIVHPLGRGGFGRVYLAYDTKLKRSVALKAMRVQSPEDLPRCRREVEIGSAFQHPNIAAVYDTESVEDVFIIAMQYIEGKSLDQLTLSTREALEIIAQAARVLQAAHDRGIIHRDLKPGNLMRTEEGRLFLLDFGTARPVDAKAQLTQSGVVLGTPAFMSPEQALGSPLDPRTDLYSLGATLYALVTHRPPFEGASLMDVLRRVMFEPPAPPRQVNRLLHRDVELIILKAMSQDPAHRYATASDLASDIDRFLAGEPIVARPIPLAVRTYRYLRRRPWAMATVAAVFFGLMASAVIFASLAARQARLSKAQGLIDQAGQKIDRWDQLMYLPPQDLTPYRSLLDAAEALCGQARELAGKDLARASFQQARAEMRKGNPSAAERSIDRALVLELNEEFLVERIRIRVNELERGVLDVADLLTQGWLQPGTIPRPRLPARFDVQFRKALVDDFARLRLLGREARKERAYLEAIEQALDGKLAQAKETARAAMGSLPAGERDHLSKVLSLIVYLEFAAETPGASSRRVEFAPAARLDEAIRHLSDSIGIRESDADLYVTRALLWLARAAVPLNLLQAGYPAGANDDLAAQQRRWREISEAVGPDLPKLDAWVQESVARARHDLDQAILLRPGDARTYLVFPSLYVLSVPFSELARFTDEWAALEDPMKNLGFLLKATVLFKRYDQLYLVPAIEACRKACSLEPTQRIAWVTLAQHQGVRWSYFLTFNPGGRAKLEEETLLACGRALELQPEPRIEAVLRSIRARIHFHRAGMRTADREDERRKAEAEVRRIQGLDPELARQLEQPALPAPLRR